MVLHFSTQNAAPQTYSDFIESIRDRLTNGRHRPHGVLPRREDVPDEQRFLLVELTDYADNTITVAMDVVTVYVVGYAADGRSYFLEENAPNNRPPIHTLFDGTIRTTLPFDGTYGGLAAAADDAVSQNTPPDRARNRHGAAGAHIHENIPILERIPLGRNELSNAISLLRLARTPSEQAVGLFVIIQMLSEAARFRSIQYLVSTRMEDEYDPLMRVVAIACLETHWSDLCEQIQRAQQRNERGFNRTIVLFNLANERCEVNSLDSPFVRGVALLLHDSEGNCPHDEL